MNKKGHIRVNTSEAEDAKYESVNKSELKYAKNKKTTMELRLRIIQSSMRRAILNY